MKSRLEKNKKKINEIDKEKRQKKAKIIIKITSIILVSIFSLLCFSMFIGAKYLVEKEVKITNDKLPNSFHGLKIVQFSDLLYPSFNEKDLDNLKNKINELKPDIIVFTGNIKRIDYELTKNDISILSKFFNSLESSMNKYAVYGTNDKNFLDILENSFIILDNKESIIYNKEIENIKIIGFNSNNVDTSKISDGSNYNICLINDPDNINKIKDKLNNIKISEEDFNRKKKVLISNEVFAYENAEAVGDIIIDNIIYNKHLEDNPIEIIDSLNMEEFLELLKKIDINNTSLVILKK